MKKNKLLRVSTADGLYLHGYYVPAEDKKAAVLNIHGMNGNFYEVNYVYILADELEKNGIGFLTVNTRGNGKDTDFDTVDEKIVRIGSRYELLEDAHLDITSWLKFLINEGYKEIILTGHSAGTIKVVRYLFEGELKDKVNKLILLAPIDALGARIAKRRNNIFDFLKKAKEKVGEGKGDSLVTSEFDHDVLSYKTFISWYRQEDLGRMFEFCSKNYNFPVLRKIKIPTKVIVGSKDEYFHPRNPKYLEEAMEILLKNIPNSTGKIIDKAGHCFVSHEAEMAREICQFILGT